MKINRVMAVLLIAQPSWFLTISSAADQGREVKVLTVRKEQVDAISRVRFVEKLNAAFSRDVPGFAESAPDDRKTFLTLAISLAETKGLKTEQGLASYALALWWLGVDFELKSKELESLLESDCPEVRKIYAMNEWVNAVIGDPKNIAAADEAMRQGVKRTEAWGPPN